MRTALRQRPSAPSYLFWSGPHSPPGQGTHTRPVDGRQGVNNSDYKQLIYTYLVSPLALDVHQECPGVLLPLPPSDSSWSARPDHQQYTWWRPHPAVERAAPEGLQTPPAPADRSLSLDMTCLFPGSPCNMSGPFSEWGPAQGPTLHFLHSLPDTQACCCCQKCSVQGTGDNIAPLLFLGSLCPRPAFPERHFQVRRRWN